MTGGMTTTFAGGLTLNSGATLGVNLSSSPDGADYTTASQVNSYNDHVTVTSGNVSLNGGTINISAYNGSLGTGTYELIADTSGTISSPGSWNFTGNAPASDTLSVAVNQYQGVSQFDLIVTASTLTGSAAWSSNASSMYGTTGNWTPRQIPDAAGQTATFVANTVTNLSQTVTINGAYTVGAIDFTSGTSFTLESQASGPASLTLNNNGNGAQVNLTNSSATLYTSLILADSGGTTFNVDSNSYLYVSSLNGTDSAISGAGQNLTLNGGGTMELASPNSYSGTTSVKAGTLQIDAGASIGSTSISVSPGATLLLAGSTAALPSTANITNGTGSGAHGNFVLTGTARQTVGVISGTSYSVPDSNSVQATAYSGNTTVGDGTNAANLTATQILQNSLTINAGSTVTIAPSDSPGGPAAAPAASSSSIAAASGDSSESDSSGSSDPFTAIQAAVASGAISSTTGQVLENRIAAIERLAATDPGLDASLLEDRVLAVLPSSLLPAAADSSPTEVGSSLLAMDSSALAGGSSGSASAAFSSAGFAGSPAAVPEPSTLVLIACAAAGAARIRAAAQAVGRGEVTNIQARSVSEGGYLRCAPSLALRANVGPIPRPIAAPPGLDPSWPSSRRCPLGHAPFRASIA